MALPDFLEEQFDEHISYGCVFSPTFSVTRTISSGGFQQANLNYADPLLYADVAKNVQTNQEKAELINFFMLVRGSAIGFRAKNWSDYEVNQQQGFLNPNATLTGNTADLRLYKKYNYGHANDYIKRIFKPVDGVKIYKNGILQVGYDVDLTTGIVDVNGDIINPSDQLYWTGEFDLPVRFEIDNLDTQISTFQTFEFSNLRMVEIKLTEPEV